MKVFKFGGTSLRSVGLQGISSIINDELAKGEQIAVVVSAYARITDELVELAQVASRGENFRPRLDQIANQHRSLAQAGLAENIDVVLTHIDKLFSELDALLESIRIVREVTPRTQAAVVSFGERAAAFLLHAVVRESQPTAALPSALEIIRTTKNFTNAHILREPSLAAIKKTFRNPAPVSILPGFLGATENDEITTLGRGGSDLTATFLGYALKAKEVVIWTHVDGFMTADPSKVAKAITIPQLTYDEALELSHFGARVIQPAALQPASEGNVPIRIKNTLAPQNQGSLICLQREAAPSSYPVTGVSSVSSVCIVRIESAGALDRFQLSQRFFNTLARERIPTTLISQASSEHSMCAALSSEYAATAYRALQEEFQVELSNHSVSLPPPEMDLSIVAVVGSRMRHKAGIAGMFFQALGRNGINVVAIAQGSSELNISAVIFASDEEKALRALHDSFFLSDLKTIHVFIAGVGLVGGELIRTLANHQKSLRQRRALDLIVVGVANSKYMLIDPNGLVLDGVVESLEKSSLPSSAENFLAQMTSLNLPNSIFVDCTASEDIAMTYERLLQQAISVVTPNKKANSGPLKRYQALQRAARASNVKFLYETNVGAGLPVIGTLQDLIVTGDKILKIEAVLSGTLSYIFNNYSPAQSFSRVVRRAKELGYTEPDPRDDLSGRDVARKLLILGREIGLALEESDVKVEPLLSVACMQAASVESFFSELETLDDHFAQLLQTAQDEHKLLRFVASLEAGEAVIGLQAVPLSHPFSSLSGSDNIISFTTERYRERPLVVKGPGAGTEVTAAGVFADIVRAASYLT